jgi:hypothetical protein
MIIDSSYLENKALNQSLLKRILINPNLFLKRLEEQEGMELMDDEEPSENIIIGDACDLILTQGENVFHNQFVVTDINKPGGQVGDYAWYLFITGSEELAYLKTGTKITHKALKNKFEKDGKSYYAFLTENRNKKVITSEQFNKIQTVVDSLRYNEFVNHYFSHPTERDANGLLHWENFYQVEVNFVYDEVDCKGLMDLIHVNHTEKKIYPVDLKVTESGTDSWEWIFWKMGYFFQASFYQKGLILNPPQFVKELLSKGYTLCPFSFVVESFKYSGNPIEYICHEDIIELGEHGGKKGNKEYKGFAEAIKKYKWHTKTGIWHYPMDVYLSGGKKWLTI